jgi:hypothetical protein
MRMAPTKGKEGFESVADTFKRLQVAAVGQGPIDQKMLDTQIQILKFLTDNMRDDRRPVGAPASPVIIT